MKYITPIALAVFTFLFGLIHIESAENPNLKSQSSKTSTQLSPEISLHRKHPKPSFETGTWWVTKTYGLCMHMFDDPKTADPKLLVRASDPAPYAEEVYYHKWTITGKEKIEKDQCWVIDIKEFKSKLTCKARCKPPEYKIYIRISDGSLAKKTKTKFSEDPFEKPQTSSSDGEKNKPALLFHSRLPIVVPWFPETWRSTVIAKQDMRSIFHKTMEMEFRQTTTTCASMELPGMQKMHVVLVIGPKEKPTTIIQTWDSVCPWYRECHIVKEGDMINTPWRSETIDWKGKAKSTPPATQDK